MDGRRISGLAALDERTQGSAEMFLRAERVPTVDAIEEAVLNALWRAERVEAFEGRVGEALPHDDVLELLRGHCRLEQ